MLFSIIIPTFNAETFIEKAILSVYTQTYEDFEIIIIDSLSKDKTLNIINNLKNYKKEIKLTIVSEADNGIYDAMNKGIKIATGKYLYFLGADDVFYNENILYNMSLETFKNDDVDIFYGNVLRINYQNPKENKLVKPFKLYNNKLVNKFQIYKNLGICHQSIFAKKETLINGFSTKYKLASDFNWILEKTKNNIRFKYVDITITKYCVNGASSKIDILFYELKEIIREHYGPFLECIFILLRKKRWIKN